MPIGVPELLIVLAIVLLLFGPKRLPGLGRSLGGGIKNFKREIRGGDDRAGDDADPERPGGHDEPLDGEVVDPERRS
jgi:sec-independent protein translocase protein TatA